MILGSSRNRVGDFYGLQSPQAPKVKADGHAQFEEYLRLVCAAVVDLP
jgi:hypothetical protein